MGTSAMSPMRSALFVIFVAVVSTGSCEMSFASASDNRVVEKQMCSSLSGPFCHHIGAESQYATYMTPIDLPGYGATAPDTKHALEKTLPPKKCFFQHFARSWMDAGSDSNDIMSQRVKSVEECEQLCCEHPKCKSYTFWIGHTCFLRARRNLPREDGHSFSANKIQ